MKSFTYIYEIFKDVGYYYHSALRKECYVAKANALTNILIFYHVPYTQTPVIQQYTPRP